MSSMVVRIWAVDGQLFSFTAAAMVTGDGAEEDLHPLLPVKSPPFPDKPAHWLASQKMKAHQHQDLSSSIGGGSGQSTAFTGPFSL